MTKYNNQTYKVDDIDDDASTNSSFLKKDGTRMTYAQYYQEVCSFLKVLLIVFN